MDVIAADPTVRIHWTWEALRTMPNSVAVLCGPDIAYKNSNSTVCSHMVVSNKHSRNRRILTIVHTTQNYRVSELENTIFLKLDLFIPQVEGGERRRLICWAPLWPNRGAFPPTPDGYGRKFDDRNCSCNTWFRSAMCLPLEHGDYYLHRPF
jgi:hypothetical protein